MTRITTFLATFLAALAAVFFILHSPFFISRAAAQTPDPAVTKVHLIFKTHLDIGFTKLPSEVERQYIDVFIPNTLKTIDALRAETAAPPQASPPELARQRQTVNREPGTVNRAGEAAAPRYIWTTGAWLIDLYLRRATPENAARLEAAIRRGDIVWNGVPYTLESESTSANLFSTILNLSHQLDARFNTHTTAAKMTDVPGHTRAIVPLLADAGITFLHIGVNGASAVPETPPVFRWRDPATSKEVIVMYQGSYGADTVLPDGQTAVSINFTHDNAGPHTLPQIKKIYADARARYPNATIFASTLNAVAADLELMRDRLPILTSEIGDTWIYGYASSPLRMARYRALLRLYDHWIETRQLDPTTPDTTHFAVTLALISEHTWGLDTKRYLKNYDKYTPDTFLPALALPEFQKMEQSWSEQDAYLDQALALLPPALQQEARAELAAIDQLPSSQVPPLPSPSSQVPSPLPFLLPALTYQTYSAADYEKNRAAYNRSKADWVKGDFGKPGLEKNPAQSVTLTPAIQTTTTTTDPATHTTHIHQTLAYPSHPAIDPRLLPASTTLDYTIPAPATGAAAPSDNPQSEIRNPQSYTLALTLHNKPPNRLPESYMLSFVPANIQKILLQKMGTLVDPTDVVPGGARQMHAIDRYLDIITPTGTIRITSLDAPLVNIGSPRLLDYSKNLPDITRGVHFCLYDNLWGTNFSMWWAGSITYRFKVEVLNSQ